MTSTFPTPLNNITKGQKGTDGKRREAAERERIDTIQLHAEGHTNREIEQRIGVSKSDVSKILKHDTETGSIDSASRMTTKTSWARQKIFRSHPKQNQYTILAKTTADSSLDCALKTAGKALPKFNYYLQIPQKKPLLN